MSSAQKATSRNRKVFVRAHIHGRGPLDPFVADEYRPPDFWPADPARTERAFCRSVLTVSPWVSGDARAKAEVERKYGETSLFA
jgi:hypothetical protein